MDPNSNCGGNKGTDDILDRNNGNENEQWTSEEINCLNKSCTNRTPDEFSKVENVKKLYNAIVTGNRNEYMEALYEIVSSENVDLNSQVFDDDYVPDIHKSLTVIQLVCGKGDEEMLQELLELNIDLNNCGKYGKSPLNIACLHGHLRLVKLLLLKGVDVNSCNIDEGCDTALITVAACYQPDIESSHSYLEIAKTLLEAGASSNKPDKDGLGPLHIAVTKSDDRFTKLLLCHGAEPDLAFAKTASPLCKALDAESFQNVKILLKHGCNVNSVNEHSQCPLPLHIAVSKNNLEILLLLLQAGAAPNLKTENNLDSLYQYNSVLHLAASKERLVILWLLLAKGGKIDSQIDLRRDTPLLILARKGSIEGVKMLLRFGADVELESQVGTTPIWAAVRENHFGVLHLLFETCCNLEIPSMEYHMYMPLTPLEIALRLQSWKMALLLLNAGASHKASTLSDAIPAPIPLRGHRIIRTRAAYRLSPEDHQALKELRTWKTQPKMLRHLCRTILRSSFKRRLPVLLQRFNYPIRLKHYLYMRE